MLLATLVIWHRLSSEKSEDAKMGDAANDEAAGEADEEKGAEETEDAGETVESKKKGPEPTSFELSNPSRVTPEQELFVSFNLEQRYVPINPRSKPAGIVILIDRNPDEPDDVVQVRECAALSMLVLQTLDC